MRPKVFTITASTGGNTYSPAYVIDTYPDPTNIGIGVDVVYGLVSAVFTVQHTFDDPGTINLNASPAGQSPSTGIWHNNSVIVNSSANIDTNYAFPPRAIRLLLSAAASAQVRMSIVQTGPL